jgi:hypothetical protein
MVAAVAALAACDGEPDGGGGVDAGPEPDVPVALAPVKGTAVDTFVTAQGEQQVPRDLTSAMIRALVPAADGSFTVYPGTGTAGGAFEIAGVPEGPYYLHIDTRYMVTSARVLDIGRHVLGRSTQRAVTGATLTLEVDGMPAWQTGDILELYAPNAGAAFSSVESFTEVDPVPGATSISMGVAYADGELPMAIDPAAGDEAFLTHSGGKISTEGVTYQALDAIAYLAPFSINDGALVTATGTFQAVAQDRTRTVDWRTTAYASMLTGAVPSGTTTFTSTFFGIVEADERTAYSVPLLYNVRAPAGTPTADLTATVTYGNPFPAAWQEHIQMSINGFRSQTLDGRSGTTLATAGLSARAEVLSGPIQPVIGPVQNVRVAGRNNTGDLNGVGAKPTVTWDPPALGTANSYSVQVVRWVPSGTNRWTRQTMGRIFTTGTSMTIPDGFLMPGEPHFIGVRAHSHPGVTFERFLFVDSEPFAWADRITTIFKP